MAIPFKEHLYRRRAADELYARPVEPLCTPVRLSHLAFMYRDPEANRTLENIHDPDIDLTFEQRRAREVQSATDHLRRLVKYFRPEIAEKFDWGKVAWHHKFDLGPMQVRWERHTEFVTYTFSKEGPFADPFAEPVFNEIPTPWLQGMPGAVIAAVHMAIEQRKRNKEALAALFGPHQVIGSSVTNDGAADVWSDLTIYTDGFMRVLVQDKGMTANQVGRLTKRFLDLSSYRPLVLRGLFLAQESTDKLSDADDRLDKIAQRMVGQDAPTRSRSESCLLHQLSELAATIEAITESTTYRFDASRAYYGMVQQRLKQLGEEHIEDLQTFTEFINACLTPAINTCIATQKRQSDLAERAARLTNLLRARVDVSLQEQSCEQLEAMRRRAEQQLNLQRMIEVLSVIPISYYLIELFNSMHRGLDKGALVGLAVPAVVGLVFLVIKRLTILDAGPDEPNSRRTSVSLDKYLPGSRSTPAP